MMRKQPFKLWLIWQNSTTRQRYHVGNLFQDHRGYTFTYEKSNYRRKLAEALKNGYRPHLAFPDTNKVYTSRNLFGPFARRLPDKRRPDYQDILRSLGLSKNCSEMELLRATGGVLATDSYELVEPILLDNDDFNLDFFIAGWRYYDGENLINKLSIGDTVKFSLDPNNEKDNKAVLISTTDGDKLGYIPAFYSGWMFEIIQNKCAYQVKITAIYPNAVPHRKIKITIDGEINRSVDINKIINDEDKLRLVLH